MTAWNIAAEIRLRLNEIEAKDFVIPGDGTGETDERLVLLALENILDRYGVL